MEENTKTKFSRDCPSIIPGLSRDSPGLLLRFPGNLVYVFPFFFPGRRETHKQFDPHPFPGQSREVVYVYWFFAPQRKTSANFLCTNFLNTTRGPDIPAKFSRHPKFNPSKPRENELSREGTNFSTPTSSH